MKHKLAIIVGRFQPLTIGHEKIIRTALENAEQVGVYIGSANKPISEKNPFTYDERFEMFDKVFHTEIYFGLLTILPLEDRINAGDDLDWGEYLLTKINEEFGIPDLFVYGNDSVRQQWFRPEDIPHIDQIILGRGNIPISATNVRRAIINNEDESVYKPFINEKLYDSIDFIKSRIISAQAQTMKAVNSEYFGAYTENGIPQ